MDFQINWQGYYASHANFILAQIQGPEAALKAALMVQGMSKTGMTFTVGDIVASCAHPGTQRVTDETWMNLTKIRINGYLDRLTGVANEALKMAALHKLGPNIINQAS